MFAVVPTYQDLLAGPELANRLLVDAIEQLLFLLAIQLTANYERF